VAILSALCGTAATTTDATAAGWEQDEEADADHEV
jgi:hypothetical protein